MKFIAAAAAAFIVALATQPVKAGLIHEDIIPTMPAWFEDQPTFCWTRERQIMHKAWTVRARNITEDIDNLCRNLWEFFHDFDPECRSLYDVNCQAVASGELRWDFTSTDLCDLDMVQTTWWRTTKNKYGALDCRFQHQWVKEAGFGPQETDSAPVDPLYSG